MTSHAFRIIAASLLLAALPSAAAAQPRTADPAKAERVEIDCDGWKIIGDLLVPNSAPPVPAVILLNGAAGNRSAYVGLSEALARVGIASLRVDLRGHGESINLGKFVPGENVEILADTYRDVAAAFRFLKADKRIDSACIGVVGASYSGEAMMVAAKEVGYAAAYVGLSPGSLTDESIAAIDAHNLPWLLVVARHERHLKEVAQALRDQSRTAEFLELGGTEHATRLLAAHPGLSERIALWFRHRLVSSKD